MWMYIHADCPYIRTYCIPYYGPFIGTTLAGKLGAGVSQALVERLRKIDGGVN